MKYVAGCGDASCRFAAKSGDGGRWLPVRAHLLDAAGIMERLVIHWLSSSASRAVCGDHAELARLCVFIAIVHDIGKLTPLFQAKILSQMPERRSDICAKITEIPESGRFMDGRRSPHALAGEAILLRLGCPPGIAAVVGAHHGKPQKDASEPEDQMEFFPANYYGYLESEENRALWEDAWRRCFDLALDAAGYGGAGELLAIGVTSRVPLTGLLIMADWIASNTFYFPLIDCDEGMDALSYPDRVERAWEKLNLLAPWSPCCFGMDGEEFAERFSFSPNAVQSAVTEAAEEAVSPGIFILEAQMAPARRKRHSAQQKSWPARRDAAAFSSGCRRRLPQTEFSAGCSRGPRDSLKALRWAYASPTAWLSLTTITALFSGSAPGRRRMRVA